MKQVTLLRNEAGYNRRIVFVEMPQSFEVEGLRWYRHASENKLVKVRWRLAGFLYVSRADRAEVGENPSPFVRGDLITHTRNKMAGPTGQSGNAVLDHTCYGKEPLKDAVHFHGAETDCDVGESSLNVNDRHYANTAVNLFGLFRMLSGPGVT